MTLLSDDQVYIQRNGSRSKSYQKFRASISDLENKILGTYQDNVSDTNKNLEQEISDRKDGDSEIYAQIDGLTDRLETISSELYDTIVSNEYTYAIDNNARSIFNSSVNIGCSGLYGEDYDNCQKGKLDDYIKNIAENTLSDSRGQFYLVTGNYRWDNVISIFLSDTIDNQIIDLTEATVGSLIEIIAIKKDDNGNDVVDNFNYGFYVITDVGDPHVETNGDDESTLYRFDVDHVGSAPREGIPSVNDGENRYIVKLVVDIENLLDKVFVNKKGDTMSGSLVQTIHDENGPVDNHLLPGFHTTNDILGGRLTLTGFPNAPEEYTPNIIEITNTKSNNVVFSSESDTNIVFNGDFNLKYGITNIVEFIPEVLESEDPEVSPSPHTLKLREKVLLVKSAEYLFPPNLLSPSNTNPGIIPPRSYVDHMDGLLQNAITDVSQRIDT